MNILIAKKSINNIKSAVNNMIFEEADFFTKKGHNVYIISENIDVDTPIKTDFTYIKTFKLPISEYIERKFFQKSVQKWIDKNKPDLVVGHSDTINQDILYMHNCVHLAYERIYKKPLNEKNTLGILHKNILTKGNFKKLICNSQMMKNDFIQRFSIDPNKIEVIYSAFDSEQFNITDKEKSYIRKESRKEFNINENDIIIALITSGDFKKRNVEGIIKAYKIIYDKYPNTKLFIAGKDNHSKYIDIAKKLGIDDRIIFAPAINDVKKYYILADIFVLPAHIEEFGRSVIEAMYNKLPVIVSPFTGASEIIENGARIGILKDLSNETIANSIEIFLNNKELCKEVGQINYNTSLKYTAQKAVEEMYDILENMNLIK